MFQSLFGNASEINVDALRKEFENVLLEDEKIDKAFRIFRDLFVFTNKRLILVDKQGLSGKKAEYLSIPYRAISRFSVETAGSWDADAELKIWFSGSPEPLQKEFKKGTDILGVQKILAQYTTK